MDSYIIEACAHDALFIFEERKEDGVHREQKRKTTKTCRSYKANDTTKLAYFVIQNAKTVGSAPRVPS